MSVKQIDQVFMVCLARPGAGTCPGIVEQVITPVQNRSARKDPAALIWKIPVNFYLPRLSEFELPGCEGRGSLNRSEYSGKFVSRV